MKKIFATLTFLTFVLLSCEAKLPKKDVSIQKADGSVATLTAEIADTQESRQHGFMWRKHIPEGTGMLFVFQQDQIMRFWMKNTPSPLSIAYIRSNGIICDIFDMVPFSENDVTSTHYARYALEVPKGWFKKMGVAVGDVVVLPQK